MEKTNKQIPKEWIRGQLGDFIIDIKDGGTPSRRKSEYFGGNIPWVVVKDIKPLIKKSTEYLTESGLNHSSAKIFPEGSVILSFGATIGEVGVAGLPVSTKQGVAGVLVDNNKIQTKYLFFLLQSLHGYLNRIATGSTIKEVRPEKIKKIRILVPPLPEQKKIANILSSVDDEIQKTDEIILQTEKLKQGLMWDIFDDPKKAETLFKTSQWQVQPLSKIAKVERGKFGHRPRNAPEFYGGDIPFIQTSDVVNSNGKITTYKQTLNEKGLAVSKLFKKGTIVITIAANIGDTGILEFDSCFPDSLIGITPNEGVNAVFLEYYLRTKKEYLNGIATQSAQKNINLEKLNPLEILLPKLSEQNKIADILSSLDEELSQNKQQKEKLTKLKKGLMQDLLSGRVRVKV